MVAEILCLCVLKIWIAHWQYFLQLRPTSLEKQETKRQVLEWKIPVGDVSLPLFTSPTLWSLTFSLGFPSYDASAPNFQPPSLLIQPEFWLFLKYFLYFILCIGWKYFICRSSFLFVVSYGNPSYSLRVSFSVWKFPQSCYMAKCSSSFKSS